MTELQRVQDAEIVEEGPSWEEHVSEWTSAAGQVFAGQMRQARVAASVARVYGNGSMEAFAKEVGASRSTVYDYARVWWIYGHILSERPDDSPLTISHYVEASYAPDPLKAIEEAEDEGLTTRQIEKRRKEPEATPQLITHIICPECSAMSPISRCETKEIPA